MKYIKTNQKHLVRDPDSNALINTDNEGYRMYKFVRDEQTKMQNLQQDMADLKSELTIIKTLLQQIVK